MAKTRRVVAEPIAETIEREEAEQDLLLPAAWEDDWNAQATEHGLDFWGRVETLPKDAESECSIYVYRLEPKVANGQGQPRYLELYSVPLEIETIKRTHGGGKYEAYLKRGRRTLTGGHHKFWIDGEPKYQTGQTDRSTGQPLTAGSAAPQPAQPATVLDIAAGTKEVLASAVETLNTAHTNAMEIQKNAATAAIAANASDRSALMTYLLDREKEKGAATQTPAEHITETVALIEAMSKLFKPERAAPAVTPVDPIAQINSTLAAVKEFTGIESLADLRAPRSAESPWAKVLVDLGQAVLGQVPAIIQQVRAMRDEDFRRSVAARSMLGQPTAPGQPATPPPAAPGTPPMQVFPPAPIVDVPANGAGSADRMTQLVQLILHDYELGADGDFAAVHVKMEFDDELPSWRDVLTDSAKLTELVDKVPPLKTAQMQDPAGWTEFQADFVAEMQADDSVQEKVAAATSKPN